jgi:hypothetical protein
MKVRVPVRTNPPIAGRALVTGTNHRKTGPGDQPRPPGIWSASETRP